MGYAASIVIPLLSQTDQWIEQAVRSAVLQTVPTEIIVVRADATPQSNLHILAGLMRQFANLSVVTEEISGSFPSALNTGIKHAGAERIGFLLSDDWLDASAVEESLPQSSDIVSTGNVVHFADGRINKPACHPPSKAEYDALPTLERKADYLSHFFLFRRQCLLDAGGLDETIGNYPGIDDYDLIWTLLERGATVSIVERGLYHYRDHDLPRLTLQDPVRMTENLGKILRKHGVPDAEASEIVPRAVRWFGKPIYRVMQSR